MYAIHIAKWPILLLLKSGAPVMMSYMRHHILSSRLIANVGRRHPYTSLHIALKTKFHQKWHALPLNQPLMH